jgi:hypothetical protein
MKPIWRVWSVAELDQSRYRPEMDRCGYSYRYEPIERNLPAWEPIDHDFPQNASRGPRADART